MNRAIIKHCTTLPSFSHAHVSIHGPPRQVARLFVLVSLSLHQACACSRIGLRVCVLVCAYITRMNTLTTNEDSESCNTNCIQTNVTTFSSHIMKAGELYGCINDVACCQPVAGLSPACRRPVAGRQRHSRSQTQCSMTARLMWPAAAPHRTGMLTVAPSGEQHLPAQTPQKRKARGAVRQPATRSGLEPTIS